MGIIVEERKLLSTPPCDSILLKFNKKNHILYNLSGTCLLRSTTLLLPTCIGSVVFKT